MKKAALHSLGCKVNSYETEAMQQMLEQAGWIKQNYRGRGSAACDNLCHSGSGHVIIYLDSEGNNGFKNSIYYSSVSAKGF